MIARNDAAEGFQIPALTRSDPQRFSKSPTPLPPHHHHLSSLPPRSPDRPRNSSVQRPCPGRARERTRAQICAVSPAMACIKSAQRAALMALAPDAPYLTAGTMTGAVDLSFSNSANIEIFRLDFQSDSPDLPLLASAPPPRTASTASPGRARAPSRATPSRSDSSPVASAMAPSPCGTR